MICSVWFAYTDNEDYNRMHALRAFTNADYRQDIISTRFRRVDCRWSVSFRFTWRFHTDGCFSEYATASKRLGDVRDDSPNILYSNRKSPVFGIIPSLLGDLPIVGSFTTSTAFECNLKVP
jgi:hypothetical protein